MPLPWVDLARQALVTDPAEFEKCLVGADALRRVASDISDGVSLGLPGTPATIIGHRLFVGALTTSSLRVAFRGAKSRKWWPR